MATPSPGDIVNRVTRLLVSLGKQCHKDKCGQVMCHPVTLSPVSVATVQTVDRL